MQDLPFLASQGLQNNYITAHTRELLLPFKRLVQLQQQSFRSHRGFGVFAWWRIVVGAVGLALLQAGF